MVIMFSCDYIELKEITPHYVASSQSQPNTVYANDGKCLCCRNVLFNILSLDVFYLEVMDYSVHSKLLYF